MSNQLSQTITADQLKTLEQAGIIPSNTPPAQVAVFAQICKEKGLSPFSKEAHLVGYGGKYSVIIGINGLRQIAAQTGQLAGCDDAKFNLTSEGKFYTAAELAAGQKRPITATVTVYRAVGGIRCPFTHTAVFSEFAGSGKWQTMPFQMIAKVAEAFALRKGFADVTGGLSIGEEGDAAMDTQEYSPLHQKRDSLKDQVDRCNFDDRKVAVLYARIDEANIDGLLAIWHEIKDCLPQDNPAEQFGERMNAMYGRKRTIVKQPTK